MALDHYVSQVHLRKFYSPPPDERLYAVRKRDGKAFQARSEDVCRIEENSTNPFLEEERIIEEFLRLVEPRYNESVDKVRSGHIDPDCIFVLSGFAAYVSTCAPAAMRLHSTMIQAILNTIVNVIDTSGKFPSIPELRGVSISELVDRGHIRLTVDPKYPQALGIANILMLTSSFGNATWEIILNEDPVSPFFTSDFPVAIETEGMRQALPRLVPLAPDVAVRIIPNIRRDRDDVDFTFGENRRRRIIAQGIDIRAINRRLIQCAENIVFFCKEHSWTMAFIEKHRHHRLEMAAHRVPAADGFYQLSSMEVRRVNCPSDSPERARSSPARSR